MGLPAIRLGWIKASSSLIDAINVRRDYTMISTGPVLDHLACIALENRDLILEQLEEIRQENIKDVQEWLHREPAVSCHLPEKGTVAFLKLEGVEDTESFAKTFWNRQASSLRRDVSLEWKDTFAWDWEKSIIICRRHWREFLPFCQKISNFEVRKSFSWPFFMESDTNVKILIMIYHSKI